MDLSGNSTQTAGRSKEKRISAQEGRNKMAVFDVGSTLVDESKVYEDRMKRIADLSGLTYEQINKYAMSFYKENKKEI